ncbi:MAG: hypothetical protein Q9165_003518 [Trypethelium subeluteriae]
MATLRSKAPQIGSTRWVLNEREQAQNFIDQEIEELTYAAKNDLEWLNEHMAEIFSSNQLYGTNSDYFLLMAKEPGRHVTDVFKTPGKLRGKTPRTARKRAPLESRAPLTDIFAPNTQNTKSPAHATDFYRQVTKLQSDTTTQSALKSSPNRQPQVPAPGKENTDSGYHGMPEDYVEIHGTTKAIPSQNSEQTLQTSSPPAHHSTPQWQQDDNAEERRTTVGSFVSAKEGFGSKAVSIENLRDDDELTNPDDEMKVDEIASPAVLHDTETAQDTIIANQNATIDEQTNDDHLQTHAENNLQDLERADDPMEVDDVPSPSESSSSEKPLLRKSSLTFASLPAREPLAKRSVGTRTSHLEQHRSTGVRASSQVGNWNGSRSITENQNAHATNNLDEATAVAHDEHDSSSHNNQNFESTKRHNESATQRLHERITMLGQAKEPRASKSIPSMVASSQNMSSHFSKRETAIDHDMNPVNVENENFRTAENDDDDDWIAPMVSQKHEEAPQRPRLAKSSSADVMEKISGKMTIGNFDQHQSTSSAAERPRTSPTKTWHSGPKVFETETTILHHPERPITAGTASLKKTGSTSQPNLASATGFVESTTPVGSPMSKRNLDGPLSASKAKLYSVLKSARGIFASSAGVSAQAKMETLSPSANRSKRPEQPPSIDQIFQPSRVEEPSMAKQASISPNKAGEGRKTRSSSEREEKRREKEVKEQRARDEQLAKVREQERLKAASQKSQRNEKEDRQQQPSALGKATDGGVEEVIELPDTMGPPAVPKANSSLQSQKPRRPMKPAKDPLPKSQPAPVSVRLPSQSKRVGQATSSNTSQSSAQDSFSSSQSKPSGPVSKASNTSLQSSTSNNNLKSSISTAPKPNSLQAAARKKELEEKAAQRKAEQKRELERKRAVKQEEERRQEQQRKAAEQQRLQEAREAAQRKALEQRKLEQQRLEQQRAQMLAKQKQANDLAAKLQQEKAQAQNAPPRADLGAARPVARMNTIQDQMRPIPHPPVNPAKPPKRAKPDDDDEQTSRPAPQRVGSSYQQTDGKRRKTEEDEEEEQEPRRSVMAPPIRNSNIRKVNTFVSQKNEQTLTFIQDQQKFTHGYVNAPPPAAHPPSMFRATVTAQHQLQQSKAPTHPNDMAKFSSAKIPFAEVANPPAGPSHTTNPNFKTPARASQTHTASTTTTTKVPLKSSPQYTPGENIALPDINTDSEDSDASDSSPAFRQPSWVNSPALRDLLTQQQLVDPEQIFGPVAPLQMEEVFRNKERHKRFRDRTSSANWSGQDRLTEEDKRRDREGRERVVRDGGWTFAGAR